MAEVKREVFSMAEESRKLRGIVEKLSGKVEVRREGRWNLVAKGATKVTLTRQVEKVIRIQIANSFIALSDMYVGGSGDQEEITGKSHRSTSGCHRSVKIRKVSISLGIRRLGILTEM